MLASYIFDGDGVGAQFVDALTTAQQRGVEVRVLIDDVSSRFSRHPASKPLARTGVRLGIFNPPLVPARLHAANLRNHRKIMVVDGALGFTGGMNIARRYWRDGPDQAYRDLHFRLRGPVVAHLAEVFCDDWAFTTGERLQRREVVPAARAGRQRAGARHRVRPRRGLRPRALGADRRAQRRAALGAHRHALLHPRQRPDLVHQRRRAARRRRRHRDAAGDRPAARAVGRLRPALAGARPRLRAVPAARPVRPHQADGGRRRLRPARLVQLGRAQPAPQLRVRRRVLQRRARRPPRRHGRGAHPAVAPLHARPGERAAAARSSCATASRGSSRPICDEALGDRPPRARGRMRRSGAGRAVVPGDNARGDPVFAVFESRIPCADCEKIKFALALYRDRDTQAPTTYKLARVYVAKTDDRIVEERRRLEQSPAARNSIRRRWCTGSMRPRRRNSARSGRSGRISSSSWTRTAGPGSETRATATL